MKGLFARGMRWAAPVIGLSAAGAAGADPIAAAAAPAAWVQYAEAMTVDISGWLQDENSEATELRSMLLGNHETPGSSRSLVLSISVKNGLISELSVDALKDTQARERLRSFLIGRHLGASAPKGMRQPVNVAIDLRKDAN
ncbi:MAG: hypothetical protein J7530_16885 [Novosphingobium sp.]|nr:hypothetical protein [Novosphingobium sp.]